MKMPFHINASVEFYPTEKGGRNGNTPADKFKCLFQFQAGVFDCVLDLKGIGSIAPGAIVTVPILFVRPELVESKMKIGDRFQLREVDIIAEGNIVQLVQAK